MKCEYWSETESYLDNNSNHKYSAPKKILTQAVQGKELLTQASIQHQGMGAKTWCKQ